MTISSETGDDAMAARASQQRTRRRMRAAALVAAACILSGGLASAFENRAPNAAPATATHAVRRSMRVVTASIDTQKVATTVDPAVVDVNTVLDSLEGGGSAAAFSKVIDAHKTGQTVSLALSTLNGTKTIQVTLGKGPTD